MNDKYHLHFKERKNNSKFTVKLSVQMEIVAKVHHNVARTKRCLYPNHKTRW